jgi:hypothetical protein
VEDQVCVCINNIYTYIGQGDYNSNNNNDWGGLAPACVRVNVPRLVLELENFGGAGT